MRTIKRRRKAVPTFDKVGSFGRNGEERVGWHKSVDGDEREQEHSRSYGGSSALDMLMTDTSEFSPERKLLQAMLERVALDFCLKDEREVAIGWVEDVGSEGDAYTFDWVCSELDANPIRLRNRFRKLFIETHGKVNERKVRREQ